jgi:hypothetical protein
LRRIELAQVGQRLNWRENGEEGTRVRINL